MKKFITSILCITLVMSLAACSAKEPEPTTTTTTTTETTAATVLDTSEATSEPEPDGTSAAVTEQNLNPASEYVEHKIEIFKAFDPKCYGMGEDETLEYHFPRLLINSSYADEINKNISRTVEKYKKCFTDENDRGEVFRTAYLSYLSKENVLSLVFISYSTNDITEYMVFNIDVKTGEKVDNARIAEIAGVSDIRKAAMDVLQRDYNEGSTYKVENYKVVVEPGEIKTNDHKNVEKTFSERYLNDKMQIGLTDEGKMFFVIMVYTSGGADFYDYVIDVDDNYLDYEDNPFWTGEKYEYEDE